MIHRGIQVHFFDKILVLKITPNNTLKILARTQANSFSNVFLANHGNAIILHKIIVSKHILKKKISIRSVQNTTYANLLMLFYAHNGFFYRDFSLHGLGYKLLLTSKTSIKLRLGHSHFDYVKIPHNLLVRRHYRKNRYKMRSVSMSVLSNFVRRLHQVKPACVYKHKGFIFRGQRYLYKIGKKT